MPKFRAHPSHCKLRHIHNSTDSRFVMAHVLLIYESQPMQDCSVPEYKVCIAKGICTTFELNCQNKTRKRRLRK